MYLAAILPYPKFRLKNRNYCAETEMTPLSQSLVTDDDTERGEGLEAVSGGRYIPD